MILRVLEPGLYTLVVDFGRPRSRSLGVPVGGAADRTALALGNALVGNPPDAPALEMSLTGPTLQAGCELACVVYGAPFALTGTGDQLTHGTTFTLRPGEELRIGSTAEGMRAYFCVRGGLRTAMVLGSRSGLEPLTAGAELGCAPGRIGRRFVRARSQDYEPRVLRVVEGVQAGWFDAEEFYAHGFTVTPASNRMGLRLDGKPLCRRGHQELLSEPVCPGAVQVTHDGRCIVLGVDGQTIGGYPKIAQVISADLDKLGQLRPGEPIAFTKVSLDEAEALYRRKQAELSAWIVRLQTTLQG
ncbi:MAG TPA: biotin-dependent carboxyltransferase family protein [Gemmataceae bacterium]|jgi:biotin-dependent carboxylase-like uncharacterized protein|nr:biotin-dependent carboxyltransferase family protein [Gemmataceae bacterium]